MADQAARRKALDEARLARLDAAARAEAAAAVSFEERVADDADRARCRLEDPARRDRDTAYRLDRADEGLARRPSPRQSFDWPLEFE